MIVYFLKVIVCSASFFALYYILLQKEKTFVFNRFYLLLSLIISFVIPIINITLPSKGVEQFNTINTEAEKNLWQPTKLSILHNYPIQNYAANTNTPNESLHFNTIITIAFITVSSLILVKFLLSLIAYKRLILKNRRVSWNGVNIILIDKPIPPHSFLKYIFINKDEYENGNIEEYILLHETVHIQQKHSLDILLIELLQIFFCFNPFLFLYKEFIKTNHEFIADAYVVRSTNDISAYQRILLNRVYVNNNYTSLASSFYFITKKRLIMLQKNKNGKLAMLKCFLTVPLLGILIMAFSHKIYSQEKPRVRYPWPKDLAAIQIYSPKPGVTIAEIKYYSGRTIKADISTESKRISIEKKYKVNIDINKREEAKALKNIKPRINITEGPTPKNLTTIIGTLNNGEDVYYATVSFRNGKRLTFDISTPEKRNELQKRFNVNLPELHLKKIPTPRLIYISVLEQQEMPEDLKYYNISAIGEFNEPQILRIPVTENVNMLQLLSMTEGVTNQANLKTIKVIRRNNDNKQINTVDLTSANSLKSPYYSLKPNDIVILDPVK